MDNKETEKREKMSILMAPNYAPAVRQALEKLIKENQNQQVEKYGKPYIVTDWDNTAIIFDSQQCLFLYQAENLCYRLTPEHFAEVIALDLTPEQKAETAELRREIAGFYRELYRRYEGKKIQRIPPLCRRWLVFISTDLDMLPNAAGLFICLRVIRRKKSSV